MRLRIPIIVRWGDLDAYGHVNNAAAFTLLEEARIKAFWANSADPDPWPTAVLGMGPGAPTQTLVARQEIEYRRPVPFLRDGIVVETWIGRLGGSSISFATPCTPGSRASTGSGPRSSRTPTRWPRPRSSW